MTLRRARLPVLLFVLGLPAAAHAHTTVQGMNDVGGGILHPFVTPAHVLILLGLGLMLGQHLLADLGKALRVFAPLTAVSLALTMTQRIAAVPSPVMISIALFAGMMVALEMRLPSVGRYALFAVAAMAIGLDSGTEAGTTAVVIKTLLGTWLGLVAGLANIAFYVSLAAERKKKWISIGLRVAGSWLVAISLLLLAFSLRK